MDRDVQRKKNKMKERERYKQLLWNVMDFFLDLEVNLNVFTKMIDMIEIP